MAQNPNWPVFDYAISFAAGPQQSSVQTSWCSVLERTETQFSGQRGKQYELDQVQPGTYKVTLRNDDGVFDPDNAASPYAPWVIPYRLFRARAQYPPTPNLLTADQATAGRVSGYATGTTLPPGVSPWAGGNVTLTNGASFSYYSVVYSASPGVGPGLQIGGWSVAPGVTYSVQCQANGTTGGLSMRLALVWLDVNGNTISASNGTAATMTATAQTLSASGTAPANAAGAAIVFLNTNSLSTAQTASCWQFQIEKAASPSSYTQPSTWYPLFTGYVERWPQTWAAQGNYGTVGLSIVDYFANLANHGLLAPFKADLMALNPNFLYALDEAQGTNAFADLTNNRGPAIVNRPNLGNVITPGQSVTSNDNAPRGPDNGVAITGAFLGSSGPVIHSNALFTSDGYETFSGYLGLPPDPNTGATGSPQSGGFTRLIAARITDLRVDGQIAWSTPGLQFYLRIASSSTVSNGTNNTFKMSAIVAGNGNTTGFIDFDLPSPGFVNEDTTVSPVKLTSTVYDSDWHLFGISLSADGKKVTLWTDGDTGYPFPQPNSVRPAAGPVSAGYTDVIGAATSGPSAGGNWIGDLALACELPFEMTAGPWSILAQSWRNAWSTVVGNAETSDERYQRILNWVGYLGPRRISAGLCKSVGPATDIATDPLTPALALTALENVTETEGGEHFVGADGAIVFQSRGDRYNKTPVVTFGERDDLGEVPYLNPGTDYDATHVANDVQLTAQYGNALYRKQDPVSQSTYGVITLARTINSIDPNEITAASQFYLQQLKNPTTRVQALTFDVGANPSLWGPLLALELGQCAGWNRRPSNAPIISLTGFIEQIGWSIDDQMSAKCTVQISNTIGRNSNWKWGTSRYTPDAGSIRTSAALTPTATTLTLITNPGSPAMTNSAGAYPMTIVIDQEQITLTAAPGSASSPQSYTVVRGVNGTTAASHLASSAISLAGANQYAY